MIIKRIATKYKIEAIDGEFHIIEKSSGSTLEIFNDRHKAIAFIYRMNKGVAFNGWTPTFFCTSFKEVLKEVA